MRNSIPDHTLSPKIGSCVRAGAQPGQFPQNWGRRLSAGGTVAQSPHVHISKCLTFFLPQPSPLRSLLLATGSSSGKQESRGVYMRHNEFQVFVKFADSPLLSGSRRFFRLHVPASALIR